MTGAHYSIGEAAKASGLTVKAVRHYEAIGLIPPTMRRSNGGQGVGHRLFSEAEVVRLRFIRRARALDLGLEEIRELVAITEEPGCPGIRPEYREVLARHLASIEERIEHLDRLRSTLDALLSAERTSMEGDCRWETCDCMHEKISIDEFGSPPSIGSRS